MIITVDLPQVACDVALAHQPPVEGPSLGAKARAAIESAPPMAGVPGFRSCAFTEAAAIDAFDYFRNTADLLSRVQDVRATPCVQAYENIRRALQLAGVRI